MALGGAASAGGGIVVAIGFASYAAVLAIFTLEENRAGGQLLGHQRDRRHADLCAQRLRGHRRHADCGCRRGGGRGPAGACASSCTAGWRSITWPELRSGLVLLTMTFIALPIMPNEPIGPFGGVNPREVWLIAIVLAGVSFAGYVCGEIFRRAPWAAAGGGGRRSRVLDRGHHRQCTARRRAAKARRVCSRPASRSRRQSCSFACWPSWRRCSRACWSWSRPRSCRGAGGNRIRAVGALAEERREGASRGRISQSVRVLVGRRICLAAGGDHRARPRGRGMVRRDRRRSPVRSSSASPTSMPSPCR